MENQINDPFFKMIALATLICGVMFAIKQPTQPVGGQRNYYQTSTTVTGGDRLKPAALKRLEPTLRKPVTPNRN
jgi:hypothetical protein